MHPHSNIHPTVSLINNQIQMTGEKNPRKQAGATTRKQIMKQQLSIKADANE